MSMISLPLPLERNLHFTEYVENESIRKITEDIIKLNTDDEYLLKLYSVYNLKYEPQPIKIYIDSYGGSVYQILGLISIIDTSKTQIHTIATGVAMSAGMMLLISGHKRFAHQNSTILYHQLSADSWGKLEGMKDDIKEYKRLQKLLEEILLNKTKLTKKKLKEINKLKKDWYISAQESLELKIIDEII